MERALEGLGVSSKRSSSVLDQNRLGHMIQLNRLFAQQLLQYKKFPGFFGQSFERNLCSYFPVPESTERKGSRAIFKFLSQFKKISRDLETNLL